jgi:dihydrofolate reductase
MRRLSVYNQVSLDGYFTDANGDMGFAHPNQADAEWDSFVAGNASGGGELVFGRVTYAMMAGFWPSAAARQQMPVVAERMNNLPKVVFSRSLTGASWNNTRVLNGDIATLVKQLKAESGPDMVILGSGSVVAQLAALRLIDFYQIVLLPLALGGGRALFEGAPRLNLHLESTRTFGNGNVLLNYTPHR